jgi:hypothetical protein
MKIKVLSLWHPHAWAMSQGVKRLDTRGKEFIALPGVSQYRGPLGIHAAKKKFDPLDCHPKLCRQLSQDGLKSPEGLVYGAVLCVVDLVDIARTEKVRESLDRRELLYGDYSDGRFALETTKLRQLELPEPLTGHQGLFYWDVPQRLHSRLYLRRCDGIVEGKAGYCPNAGMEWQIHGLNTITVHLCNECCHASRKAHPGLTFEVVRREVVA